MYGLAATLWLSLRSYALRGSAPATSPLPWSTIILTAPKILLFNLYRTVLPLGLSPHYDFRLIEAPSGEFLLTLLALLALAALAIAAARHDPRFWTAFAWLILPVLPTLDLRLMNEDDFIHDRYTYMSMLGVALLVGFAYSCIEKEKWPQLQFVRLLAAAIVVVLAFASAIQSQYWANDVNLFSRAASRAPENEWAQLNYGSALSDRHRYGDAAPYFVRSYELKPGWRAADFAGFAYQQSGDLPQAERWFRTALQQNPDLANAWFGLAQIRLAQHAPDQAIDFLNKALDHPARRRGISLRVRSGARTSLTPIRGNRRLPARVATVSRSDWERRRPSAACRRPEFRPSEASPARIPSKGVRRIGAHQYDQPLNQTDTNCQLPRRILARSAAAKAVE